MMELVCTSGQTENRSSENVAMGSSFCQQTSEFYCLAASVQLEKPYVGNTTLPYMPNCCADIKHTSLRAVQILTHPSTQSSWLPEDNIDVREWPQNIMFSACMCRRPSSSYTTLLSCESGYNITGVVVE